jgi:DNA-binding response OmpR family regulator
MAHILVIDDSPTIRAILKSALEGKGYQVTEGADGEQALELAQTQKPDLILLDALLPKLDGWKACKQLKAMPLTQPTPIFMLTGQTQEIEQLRGWEAGADEYIAKSDDLGPLLTTIEKRLLGK